MKSKLPKVTFVLFAIVISPLLQAEIFRWDNGALIPGTEDITPGPGVHLRRMDLEYADLSYIDLTGADLSSANLANADFQSTNLSHLTLAGSRLTSATFDDATLTWAVVHSVDGFTKERESETRGTDRLIHETCNQKNPC